MKFLSLKSIIILGCLSQTLSAQNNGKLKEIASEYAYNNAGEINFIKLKNEYTVNESSVEGFLNQTILNGSNVTVNKIKSESDYLGYLHLKYQLKYKNALINNAIIIVHLQNGKIISINGDLNAIEQPTNTVNLSEKTALQLALKKVNAKVYKWDNKAEEQHLKKTLNNPNFTFYPKGNLIIYTKYSTNQKPTILYAYKFNIYAQEPLYKANVIVDAQTGIILVEENLICTTDVPATAVTKYSGTQTMTVDNYAAGSYRLREVSRGLGIETYNMQNTSTYSATDFTNTSTTWSVVNIDQAARDAHWGAENTYDYYFNMHGRNSIDNAGYKLQSYVHYNTNYNNAFWDGTVMTYGDGDGSTFTILTALDVCGHEITHGLTENTSNLNYSNESGALNESYSDIFGTLIENYARPLNWDWKIGQDMTPGNAGIRSMSNPNLFSDPDTYLGTYWYSGTGDNGGVHTNSGVSNFWFYLLSQGGSGTNDIGSVYNVIGISKASAAQIAFRALTVYYTPSTNYANARALSIQAAKDIFGNCSNEVVQTTNAWYAVGVGPAYTTSVTANFIANATSFCTLPASVNFNNTTTSGNTYLWNFGDGSVSTSTNPVHTYTAAGTYTVKLKANGCLTAVDSITKPSYIVISIPNNPSTIGASRCGAGTVSLSASGTSQLYWYASPTATGTPLTIGNNYVTPVISSNTTYYVVNTSSNVPVFGAATNTSIGAGGNYNTASQYQIFDVIQASTLKSVVIYASTAGNRTIELRNSANTVITSTIVNLAVGANTVNINFSLTPGTSYQLGLASTSAVNLYRNSAGGVYPYNIGGLVNVTGSSAGGGYYYFYYNWQIQKNNCTSSPIAVTATVNTPPVLTVNSPTICSGQSVNVNASAATSYTWSTGSNAASINVSPTSTSIYSLTASSGVACNSSITSTVTVIANPTVSVNSATICSGQTASLTASGASSYSWSTGQTTNAIIDNPTSNTSYTVYGNSGSCSDISVANIIVNPLPVVSVSAAQIQVCLNDGSVLLTGSPSGGTYSGIGVTGNSFNPNIAIGNYYPVYAYTDANGCSAIDSVNIVVSVCTGIKSLTNNATFLVYPNPASDYFNVSSVENSGLTLTITDALSKIIMVKDFTSTNEKIDIRTFAKGIYFIEVKENTKSIYRTIIVKD